MFAALVILFLGQPNLLIDPYTINYPTFKQTANNSVLEDIYSHYDPKSPTPITTYLSSAPITSGHEVLHGVNANLRRPYQTKNGFYLLNNRAILFEEPKVTIQEVAASVPNKYRQYSVFQLYMVDQARPKHIRLPNGETYDQSWNNQPLYIHDELNSYIGGAAIRKDLKLKELSYTYEQAIAMWIYSVYLLKKIDKTVYPEYDKLLWFTDYQWRRIVSYEYDDQDRDLRKKIVEGLDLTNLEIALD